MRKILFLFICLSLFPPASKIFAGGLSQPGGLPSNPSPCPANQFVNDQDINGGLTCAQPSTSNLSDGSTICTSGGTTCDLSNNTTFVFPSSASTPSTNGQIVYYTTTKRLVAALNNVAKTISHVDDILLLYQGGSAGSAASTSSVSYMSPCFMGGATTIGATENLNTSCLIGQPGTFSKLYCEASAAPSTGKSWTLLLRRRTPSGADSAITCPIADTATSCVDNTHTYTASQGDWLEFKVTPASTPTSAAVNCSIMFNPS